MEIYFPVAEVAVNVFVILGLGIIVGMASGLFGVGGGFLMTPLLIFIGIPAPVAVGTQANQLVAASFSGFLANWRRRQVDLKMGLVLLVGGLAGSWTGVWLFGYLKALGQIDVVIAGSYVVFLGGVSILLLKESLTRILGGQPPAPGRQPAWARHLPLRLHFPESELHVSVILPIIIGFIVGVLVSIMGIGGGLLMVPAMIYLLGMPASKVTGTSLFQVMIVTALVCVLQIVKNNAVDLMLALPLIITSAIGAQAGARWGQKLKPEQVRLLLGIIVLLVAVRMLLQLVLPPADIYTFEVMK